VDRGLSEGLWRPALSYWAGLLPFLCLGVVGLLLGCGESYDALPGDAGSEDSTALGLARGAEVHSIVLSGRGAEEHVVPTLVNAVPGDAVEFRSVDHRVHTVWFPPDSLAPEILAFLQVTDQLAGPPLVNRGSRFILRLEDAPSGRYVFLSDGHGGIAHGVIEVTGGGDSGDG